VKGEGEISKKRKKRSFQKIRRYSSAPAGSIPAVRERTRKRNAKRGQGPGKKIQYSPTKKCVLASHQGKIKREKSIKISLSPALHERAKELVGDCGREG